MHPDIAVAKAMRVIAPFDSAQGAMTLIALTALAVAISGEIQIFCRDTTLLCPYFYGRQLCLGIDIVKF
jgi:hypothetical protein